MARGELRIYMGAAPGVGKTYAMLNEGRRRLARGTDVVVGLVETHGRPQTAAQLAGLEVVPRRQVPYKGALLDEMDLNAILARRPDVVLVDELAHTNVPGSRHEKRWADVEELRAAGIDVISTLNVQHLESLNDVLAEITGVHQRETVPDAYVRTADQIELVDMTPEALRRRMAHGNVYPSEQVDTALANYFRPGNLAALREMALLWVADRVDEFLDRYRAGVGITKVWETRERVVVAVSGTPEGEALIRRAARMAERAHGELLGVHVDAGDGLAVAPRPALADQRDLLVELGGRYHEVVGADVPTALVQFAAAEGATQLVLGATQRSRWTELVQGSVINRVVRASGPIDVHIISPHQVGPDVATSDARRRGGRAARPAAGDAARATSNQAGPAWPAWLRPRPSALTARRRRAGWGLAAVGLVVLTALLDAVVPRLGLTTDMLAFLLLTMGVAVVGGTGPALTCAVGSAVVLDWFFTPPQGTLTVTTFEDVAALVAFSLVAVVVAWFVSAAARRDRAARRATGAAGALAATAGATMRHDDPLPEFCARLRATFGQDGVAVLRSTAGEDGAAEATGVGVRGGASVAVPPWTTEAAAGDDPPAVPEAADTVVQIGAGLVLALSGPALGPDDVEVLTAFTSQMALAFESRRLAAEAARATAAESASAARAALLYAVSHDLSRPLTAIRSSLASLQAADADLPPDAAAPFVAEIAAETDRLERRIGDLADMARLQSETLQVLARPTSLGTIVDAALAPLDDVDLARITRAVPASTPTIAVDAALVERSVANVVANALAYTPAGSPVRIEAGVAAGKVVLRVIDRGPGIAPSEREQVLHPFRRLAPDRPALPAPGLGLAVARGFVEALGGEFGLDDTPGGGLTVTMTFPPVGAVTAPDPPASGA